MLKVNIKDGGGIRRYPEVWSSTLIGGKTCGGWYSGYQKYSEPLEAALHGRLPIA